MTSSSKEGPPGKLSFLIRILDNAVKAVPAARYYWGVIAASATVAIIGLLNGLNRLTFVAMVATLGAMLVFYIFSQFEKASDPVVKLLGYVLLIVAASAFIFWFATSAWLAVTCTPRLFAHLYGVSEVCYGPSRNAFSEKQSINTLPNSLGGKNTINLDNVAILSLGDPLSIKMATLYMGPVVTYPNTTIPGKSVEDRKVIPFDKMYIFDLAKNQRHEVVVSGRTFIVTLLEIKKLNVPNVPNPIEYVFGISEQ
jgi:hypothetical protein